MKVDVIYNKKGGYITYRRGNKVITAMLQGYDAAEHVEGFDSGLLTIVMRKGKTSVEEFVDFTYALSLIGQSKQKNAYFEGVTKRDLWLKEVY